MNKIAIVVLIYFVVSMIGICVYGTYRNTSYGVDSGAVRRLPGEIVVEVSEVG